MISIEKDGYVALWEAKVKPDQMVTKKRIKEHRKLVEPIMSYFKKNQ